MAGLIVIGPEDMIKGFRLAGFEVMEVSPDTDATSLVEKLAEEGKYTIIFMEDSLFNSIQDELMRRIRKKGLPVVVPLSVSAGWKEGLREESPVARLIRRAIGYHIKIKK